MGGNKTERENRTPLLLRKIPSFLKWHCSKQKIKRKKELKANQFVK